MKNSLKILPFLFLFCCDVPVEAEPEITCFNNVECAPGETCEDNICIKTFEPFPANYRIVDCKCWEVFIYVSEIIPTNKCDSGYSVVRMCTWCCEFWRDECIQPALSIYCLRKNNG